MTPRTSAIIVTFRPVLSSLQRLLSLLQHQVDFICIVHNGASRDEVCHDAAVARVAHAVIAMEHNSGIACAFNRGMEEARKHAATHVVLFDQDSEPALDMVKNLLDAERLLMSQGVDVAAVGPCFADERHNHPTPFFRIERWRLKRITANEAHPIVPVDYLISSGCLIPLQSIDRIGGMRDDFFIDYVDIEWGLRARRAGLQSFGVFSARMKHRLGEHPVRFGGRSIIMHTPERHYYQFRNAVRLYLERMAPLSWKLCDGMRLLRRLVFYAVFARPRIRHMRMMVLGIIHGIQGKMGALRSS